MDQAQTAPGEERTSSTASTEESQALSAGQYLDKALNLIGKKMRSAATLVRERGPKEGTTRGAFESASDVLDSAGRYMMREHVSSDVRGVVSRHPGRTIAVCFLAGFIAGSTTRRVRM